MIAIIDYASGNLRSVQKSMEHAGIEDVVISGDPAVVAAADGLVLPGVGSFGDAAANLRDSGVEEVMLERIAAGVPFLGICLGMQLLADVGYEDGEWQGLGLVHGTCERLPGGVKIPHMGWNTVSYARPSRLFDGIPEDSAFYFVHSYHLSPTDEECVSGRTEYGIPFAAAVEKGSIFGVQFHPEKSSEKGLRLLANFGAIVSERA